jgi:TorA maturation chaperone TorD
MSTVETHILHTPATHRLLRRAAMYEALALAFGYPDDESFTDLEDALAALLDHEAAGTPHEREAIAALAAALAATDAATAAVAHNRLFAGEVTCSACETAYEADAFAKARQLADIAGFYRAFGLKVAADRPGPADTIDAELEFMAQLVMREAYAAVWGWDDKRQICVDAQRAFIEDHLGRWAPLFCRAVRDQDDAAGLYAAAATVCEQFLGTEIEAAGARPRPATARRSTADDAGAFTCMFAAACQEEKEGQP